MAKMILVTGVTAMIAKMKAVDKKTEVKLTRGLIAAGRRLQRESQLVVPIKTGNLKGSAFTRNMGGKGKTADIVVGYTAGYAIYVHELIHSQHKEGKQAKYLEEPARIHRDTLLKIIGEHVYGKWSVM